MRGRKDEGKESNIKKVTMQRKRKHVNVLIESLQRGEGGEGDRKEGERRERGERKRREEKRGKTIKL